VGKRGGLTHLPLSLRGRGVGWQVGVGWLAIWIRFEHVCLLARRGGNWKARRGGNWSEERWKLE
jgi:hypothetical protein